MTTLHSNTDDQLNTPSISQESTTEQRSFFDLVAKEYDRFIRTRRYDLDYAVLDHYVGLRPLGLVLDLATGSGKIIGGILSHAPSCIGIGLDISRNMLRVASDKVTKAGNAARFQPINADVRKIPFESSLFDLVCIGYALHHFRPSSRSCILQEAFRVLRPDGHIAVLEIGRAHFVEALSLGKAGSNKLDERIQPNDIESLLVSVGFSFIATVLRTERIQMSCAQVVDYLRVQGIVRDKTYLDLLTSRFPELVEITHQRYLCIGAKR